MLTLTQSAYKTLLLCPRLFRHRYLDQLAWPDRIPGADEQYARRERGTAFHLLVRRALERRPLTIDPELLVSYQRWQELALLELPSIVTVRPELELNVPFGEQLLRARLDLLVIDPRAGTVTIWDWKLGGAPRIPAQLREDPQTLWYLYLTAAAWPLLRRIVPGLGSIEEIAERLSMVYWFAEPEGASAQLIRVPYSTEQFRTDAQRIGQAVATMVERPYTSYEQTTDQAVCNRCQYRSLCYRTPGPLQRIEQDVAELLDWELDLDLALDPSDAA